MLRAITRTANGTAGFFGHGTELLAQPLDVTEPAAGFFAGDLAGRALGYEQILHLGEMELQLVFDVVAGRGFTTGQAKDQRPPRHRVSPSAPGAGWLPSGT